MPIKTSFTLPEETIDQISDIVALRELSRTRVIVIAIRELHQALCQTAPKPARRRAKAEER